MLAAKSMVGLFLLVLFALSSRASNAEEAGETPLDVCASCDESKCPPVTMCPVGEVKDYCGCCSVCGLEQGHRCNTRQELHDMLSGRRRHGYYGACGKNLECQPRTDVDEQSLGEESICVCTKPGRFCASNGETYSACELEAVQAKSFGEVFLISYDDCKSEPKIVAASESQRVPGGNRTTFWCEIKGYPLPTVTWYYFAPGGSYEAILLPGRRAGAVAGNEGTLPCGSISRATGSSANCPHTGVGERPVRQTAKQASGLAYGQLANQWSCPSNKGPPNDALRGDSDEMSVSLRGAPPGRRIISHLQIRRFDIKYEGIYQCYVENDLGSDRHNITAIYAPPEPRPRDL